MPINREQILLTFEKDLEKIRLSLMQSLQKAMATGLTDTDILTLSTQLNFFDELRQLGLDPVVEGYLKELEGIVAQVHKEAQKKGLAGLTGASAQDLEALMNVNKRRLLGRARVYTEELEYKLVENIVAGTPIDVIAQQLNTEIPLYDTQLKAAINTGIGSFEASTVAKIYEDEPGQRFVLDGAPANDPRIRCSCKGVMTWQKKEGYTKEQIDKGAWTKLAKRGCKEFGRTPSEREMMDGEEYSFIFRGGFNCRHRPKPK